MIEHVRRRVLLSKNINKVNQPQRKLFTSIEVNPKKVIKEFRVDKNNNHIESDFIRSDQIFYCTMSSHLSRLDQTIKKFGH